MRVKLERLLEVLLGAGGDHPRLRRAAAARAASLTGGALPAAETLPAALQGWVERVTRAAWRITDEDVAALRAAGFDEDAIFEVTIAAATGAGMARYQIAERALKAAGRAPSGSGAG